MAPSQPAIAIPDVEQILTSCGLTTTCKCKVLEQATKMVAAGSESKADPFRAEKEECLARAAVFARVSINRALEPFSLEPARSWELSETLSAVLKDLVAVCPDEESSKIFTAALDGFHGGAGKSWSRRYEARVNTMHNHQPGLLSSMPPEILERIMMHVPPKIVNRACTGPYYEPVKVINIFTCVRSSMACKSLYQAYNFLSLQACTANTASIELTWTIDNFMTQQNEVIYGPGDGVEALGRRWKMQVHPKGGGTPGKDTLVSAYLHGDDANWKECFRLASTIRVPSSVPDLAVSSDHTEGCNVDAVARGISIISRTNLTVPTKTILHNGSLTLNLKARIHRYAVLSLT